MGTRGLPAVVVQSDYKPGADIVRGARDNLVAGFI